MKGECYPHLINWLNYSLCFSFNIMACLGCLLGDHSSQALHLPVSFPALKHALLPTGLTKKRFMCATECSSPEARQGAQAAPGTWTSPKTASSTFSWSQRLPQRADFPIHTPEIWQTQAVLLWFPRNCSFTEHYYSGNCDRTQEKEMFWPDNSWCCPLSQSVLGSPSKEERNKNQCLKIQININFIFR